MKGICDCIECRIRRFTEKAIDDLCSLSQEYSGPYRTQVAKDLKNRMAYTSSDLRGLLEIAAKAQDETHDHHLRRDRT